MEPISTMDGFRVAVRNHWHRGTRLLTDDWESSGNNYDKFLETLIVRRAELSEAGKALAGNGKDESEHIVKPIDASAQLVKALSDIGVTAQVKGVVHGPRVTRYRVCSCLR